MAILYRNYKAVNSPKRTDNEPPMQQDRSDSKEAMTVTTGLSAVEALTKAKNEGGFARPCPVTDTMLLIQEIVWENGEWMWRGTDGILFARPDRYIVRFILEPWEHHATSDTL